MRYFTLLLTVLSLYNHAHAASIVNSYDERGNTSGVLAIVGITQESSWACKGDTSISCKCSTTLLQGKIAKIDYQYGSAVPEGFVFETDENATYIGLPKKWDQDLGGSDRSWITHLINKKEQLLIAVEICGVSGRNIIARDIYSLRMLK